MGQEEGSDGPELVGRPVEEAVEAVLDEDGSRDPGRVRAILETVAEDGVVSEEAVEDELKEVSKVVSTPETRIEFAAMEVADAKETAEDEGVADMDTVRARMETYESRLEAAEEAIGALGPDLREVVGRRGAGANAYEVAVGIREVRAEADELHRAADELGVDAEEFGRWLTDPEVRYDEFGEEIEAVERSLEALSETASDLADGGDWSALPAEPGVVWADARMRTRVTKLLLADVGADLANLRAWPGLEETDAERLDELGARLGSAEERCRDLDGRLDELARPAWTDRFGDPLDRFDDALDRFDPPVAWGEVQAELERHRETLGAT